MTHITRCLLLSLPLSAAAFPLLAAAPATTPPATQPTTRPAQTPVLSANTVLSKNVAYGQDPLQTLDIYAPKNASGAPVLLFIHGGEWSRGDKEAISTKPRFFNDNNILFVSANYRLSPKDPHPAQVDDVAASIAFLKTNIAKYGGDPAKIVIMGHSAGCHLVSLVSLDPQFLAKVHLKPTDLRATIAWSGGMYDLVARAKGTGMYPPFIKATFTESEEAQRAASPLTHAKNAKNTPPFLIASCDDEKSQSSREASKQLADTLNASGGHAEEKLLTGKVHFTANHEIGLPNDPSSTFLLHYIQNATK